MVTLRLTEAVKIILAGLQLEERNEIPFTMEALTLEVWKMWPDTFGMKGFEKEHPDTHKIRYNLMGANGLIKTGQFLQRVDKTLLLTPEGRDVAYEVATAYELPLGKKPKLPVPVNPMGPEGNEFLLRVLDSSVVLKYLTGEKEGIGFREAINFWDVPEGRIGNELIARENAFAQRMQDWQEVLKANGEIVLPNGRSIGWPDFNTVREVDNYLKTRYKGSLGVLRSRPAPVPRSET